MIKSTVQWYHIVTRHPGSKKLRLTTEQRYHHPNMRMYIDNFAGSAEAWSQMKSEFPNIKVKTFPPVVLKAMKTAADDLYEEYAAKDASFKEVLESQRAFMKKARAWTLISEYDYIKTSEEIVK